MSFDPMNLHISILSFLKLKIRYIYTGLFINSYKKLKMENVIYLSISKCDTNSDMFYMLCKRYYYKPITVKFVKTEMYYKKDIEN